VCDPDETRYAVQVLMRQPTTALLPKIVFPSYSTFEYFLYRRNIGVGVVLSMVRGSAAHIIRPLFDPQDVSGTLTRTTTVPSCTFLGVCRWVLAGCM
jgi:hypothetical protein